MITFSTKTGSTKTGLLALLTLFLLVSCDNDDDVIIIDNPSSYTFTRGGTSTVSFSGQTTRILMASELVSAMSDFNQSKASLIEMYSNQTAYGNDANPYINADLNQSSKSVKSKVAASNDFFSANTMESAQIKTTIQSWIEAQVTEVKPAQNQLAKIGQAGQIADGGTVRYVNSKGLEYNQAVTKSLIGALMVDQICNNYLSPLVLDADQNRTNNDASIVEDAKPYTSMEHKWDEAYGYLFGIATDETDPLATIGEGKFLNKYLSRVNDDADFSGIAEDIYEAFKSGRAAIVAGDYDTRDAQANIIKDNLSEVIAIRAIYYLQQGKNALALGDVGGAFHDLSEGFGFVYSLRFTRQSDSTEPYFSSETVESYISQLTTGNGFWDLDSETLDALSESIAKPFSFTVAQAAE